MFYKMNLFRFHLLNDSAFWTDLQDHEDPLSLCEQSANFPDMAEMIKTEIQVTRHSFNLDQGSILLNFKDLI